MRGVDKEIAPANKRTATGKPLPAARGARWAGRRMPFAEVRRAAVCHRRIEPTPGGKARAFPWQVPTPAELPAAGWHDIPEDAVDIDIAIGEPHDLGGGVASQALRLLIERLRSSTAVSMIIIIIGTSLENRRAIRAYQRAGFERDRVFDDPELGRRWLCVVKPAPNRFNADRLFRRAPRPAG